MTDEPTKRAAPKEVNFADIRSGARAMLAQSLEKAWETQGAPPPGDCAPDAPAAQVLERAVYNAATKAARGRVPLRRAYVDTLRAVAQALPVQSGPFPEDVPGVMYVAGRKAAEVVVDEIRARAAGPAGEPDPRETIRRLFVATLIRASPEYARHRERALETARTIEVSCFNAAVRASKESEEPPRRQWDSAPFVDIYSTRCGTIAGQLDPASGPCLAYGATLTGRLWAGDLRPEDLGTMTEKELCPAATAAERAEIEKRLAQKVVEKESNLFRCPHCGARRCTYRGVQRRSLDEAQDYLCYCIECKRRFTGRS